MKKYYLIAMLLWFTFTGFGDKKKIKVIFFGDSITAAGISATGYITKTDSIIRSSGKADQFELVGSGNSGDKVVDLYLRMEEDVLVKKPEVVVIWIGVNDVWHTENGTGTGEETFTKFYSAVLTKLKSRKISVYLCTPLAIGEKKDMGNRLDDRLNLFAGLVRQLAAKNNCRLIDLRAKFISFLATNNPENKASGILTTDGVHLTEAGNLFVARQMVDAISINYNDH